MCRTSDSALAAESGLFMSGDANECQLVEYFVWGDRGPIFLCPAFEEDRVDVDDVVDGVRTVGKLGLYVSRSHSFNGEHTDAVNASSRLSLLSTTSLVMSPFERNIMV